MHLRFCPNCGVRALIVENDERLYKSHLRRVHGIRNP